jgi:pimeloyl-ACP methyl ester carboxylesterase
MPIDPHSGVFYELHGEGAPLMLTLPLMASHTKIFGAQAGAVKEAYLAALSERYRVLLLDYPSIGASRDIPPDQLTAERVCSDLLSVATAAGFERFAYCGYSWSAAVGLQLAARSNRLTALAIGGWPPLGAPYAEILAVSRAKIGKVDPGAMVILRNADQYRQWSTFYASIVGHWDEAAAVGALDLPKLIYFGGDGDLVEAGIDVKIASLIRANRKALESQGWLVRAFPGHGHDLAMEAAIVAPVIRAFLDRALLQGGVQ